MQLKTFKTFVFDIIKEGIRLQKYDINGQRLTKWPFTHMQLLSFALGILFILFFPTGFPNEFAGYIISFLGIFIGLFTSLMISIHEKSDTLYFKYNDKPQEEKVKTKKIGNYLIHFTGLTSYAILMALFVTILLSIVLLKKGVHIDIWEYKFVNFNNINYENIKCFFKVSLVSLHRFLITYYLSTFFAITIYSISSYFSYLLFQYRDLKKNR